MLTLLASFLFLLGSAATPQEAGGPEWLDDLDQGFALAAESDRPLLIVFR